MPKVPNPKYDYNTDKLVVAYQKAIANIYATLDRIDISNMTRANTAAMLTEVSAVLASLNEESAAWVAENIPLAARDGVLSALVALDVKDVAKVAAFNKINRELVAAIVADTQADLLAVTQNIDRRVRTVVRQVTAESMRANMTRGINGRKTISRDILDGLKKKLGDSVNTGIIDSAGRRWKPEVYTDMIVRTKTMQAHKEASINEAVGRGALYGVISRHGATDACRKWEGRIVKLVPEADGDYPYIGDIPRNEIFHPCCRHVVTPTRIPLSESKPRAENPLPNYDKAELNDKKFTDYALNPEHPVGKHKALVFDKVLGYNSSNWEELRDKIRDNLDVSDALEKEPNNHGRRFEVVMDITGPSGRTAPVTTAWIMLNSDDKPILTTLLIKEEGK